MTEESAKQILARIEAKIAEAKSNPGRLVKIKAGWYVMAKASECYELDYVGNEEGVSGWHLRTVEGCWLQSFRTLSEAKKAIEEI